MNSLSRHLNCALLLTLLAGTTLAQDDSPLLGRRVLIIKAGAEIKTQEGVMWRAYLGEVFTVSLVKGEWLWIHEKQGWLNGKEAVEFSQAVEYFTREVQRNPSTQAYHSRGIANLAHGRLPEAIEDFSQSIRHDPKNAGAYNNRGNAWRQSGDHQRAISDYSTAIQLDPKNFIALHNRGVVRSNIGEVEGALADYEKSLELNPKYAEAYNDRGVIYRHKGDLDRAIQEYSRAIEIDGNYVPAYGNRGFAWKMKGNYDAATADFTKAMAITPDSPAAINDLAYFYATCPDERFRDPNQALELATKATKLAPDNWNVMDTLGACYAANGRFEEAMRVVSRAIEVAPTRYRDDLISHQRSYAERKPLLEGPKPVAAD